MMPLDPPFLEFAFYVGSANAHTQGIRAAEALVRAGARFTGEIDIADGDAVVTARSVRFDSIEARAGGALRRIYLEGASGLTKKTELIEVNRGLILLRTEGEEFSGPNRAHRSQLYGLGAKAYACFKVLALAVESYYGALCGEYSLEEPAELKRDPRSLAFRNFFLSRAALGSAVDAVRASVGDDVYLENIDDRGLYVSMSPEFNPDHRAVEPIDAQYRSVRVAELLVKHLRIAPS